MKEDQEHLTACEGYEDLRGDADMGNETELVEFFTKVMGRRTSGTSWTTKPLHNVPVVN